MFLSIFTVLDRQVNVGSEKKKCIWVRSVGVNVGNRRQRRETVYMKRDQVLMNVSCADTYYTYYAVHPSLEEGI